MRQYMKVLRLRDLVGIFLLRSEAIYVEGWTYKSIVLWRSKKRLRLLFGFFALFDRLCY